MKINSIKVQEITDFENQIGHEIIINERENPTGNTKRYYAHFKGGEIIGRGVLIGSSGDGNTIDKAIANYAKEISSKVIVFGAYTNNRKEIKIPKLIHTKFVENGKEKSKTIKRKKSKKVAKSGKKK